MRASEAVKRIPLEVMQAFMTRLPPSLRDRVHILQNPTNELVEELAEAKRQGRGWSNVALYAQGMRQRRMLRGAPQGSSGKARLEENYFYGSRRFPKLANNTIGSGPLAQGDYDFFTKGVGDVGDSLGFPSGFVLGTPETNMEGSGGQVAQGTNFALSQLGVTFNSDIAIADLAVMLDAVTLEFAKAGGQWSISHGPLKMWPAGMGIAGFASSAGGEGAVDLVSATNGSPDLRSLRHLQIPRVLRAGEIFKYRMHVERPTKAKDGSTIALSSFVVATIWLFGGQKNAIPT